MIERQSRTGPRAPWVALAWVAACASCTDPPAAPPPRPPLVFEDVTLARGLPSASQACLVLRDFDGDGWPDLLTARAEGDGPSALLLFHNDAGRGFTPTASAQPLSLVLQCASADVDGDGRLDVVAVGDRGSERGVAVLLRGAADGTFAEGAQDASLAALVGGTARAVAFLDANADGRPDLAVNYHPLDNDNFPPTSCEETPYGLSCTLAGPAPTRDGVVLLNGPGGFSRGPSLDGSVNVNVATAVDLDADGAADLFLSREFGQSAYLRGGGGAFAPTDLGLPVARSMFAMGVGLGDFDGDGSTDLYVADFGHDHLFLARRGGGFDDVGDAYGVTAATANHSGWSPLAEDFDLDGATDLYLAQSLVGRDARDLVGATLDPGTPQYDLAFRGGGATLAPFRVAHRTAGRDVGLAATAAADFDGDGRLDVAVAFHPDPVLGQRTIGALRTPELRLMRNATDVGANHWLGVRLRTRDGRDPLVAVVDVEAGSRTQRRFYGASNVGAPADRVHVGLGGAARATVKVTWPGGRRTTAGPFEADRVVVVTEP